MAETQELSTLLDRCKAAAAADEALARDLREALKVHVPGAENLPDPASALASTDGALEFAARALPGWSLRLDGGALPVSTWSCVLREGPDDDQTVGAGFGATPAIAITAAVLNVVSGFEHGFH